MPKLTIAELNELKELKKKEAKEAEESGAIPEPSEVVDPATLDSEQPEPEPQNNGTSFFPRRNKRGRKPKADKDTISDLNGLLWMIHQGIASLTGIEEFALDPSESEELSKAIARVQAFYPTSILSPLAMAWTGLFVTGGKIYGTRIIAFTTKKKRKKAEIVEIPLPPGTTTEKAQES